MAIMKRATEKLRKAGIDLQVRKGRGWYYLHDPALTCQCSTFCHLTAEEAVEEALAGGRPWPLDRGDGEASQDS